MFRERSKWTEISGLGLDGARPRPRDPALFVSSCRVGKVEPNEPQRHSAHLIVPHIPYFHVRYVMLPISRIIIPDHHVQEILLVSGIFSEAGAGVRTMLIGELVGCLELSVVVAADTYTSPYSPRQTEKRRGGRHNGDVGRGSEKQEQEEQGQAAGIRIPEAGELVRRRCICLGTGSQCFVEVDTQIIYQPHYHPLPV